MVSQMSIPFADRMAMPGLRLDAGLLSIAASAPDCGIQVEPADGADAALHRLRFFGIHPECDYREAPAAFHSHAVSLGVVRRARLLLGLPQHTLVPIRLVAEAQDVILRFRFHVVR